MIFPAIANRNLTYCYWLATKKSSVKSVAEVCARTKWHQRLLNVIFGNTTVQQEVKEFVNGGSTEVPTIV